MTYSTPHRQFIAVRHSCSQLEDTNLVISEVCVCVCVSSRVVLVTEEQVRGISRAAPLRQEAKKRLGHEQECWE